MDSLVGIVLFVFMLGIGAAYPTRALLLMERDSHEGPFRIPNWSVRFPSTGHTQHVALFDVFRYPFGIYRVNEAMGTWDVRENANITELFTCQFCLGFWVCVPFTFFFCAHFGLTRLELLWAIPVHFALCAIVQMVHKQIWG